MRPTGIETAVLMDLKISVLHSAAREESYWVIQNLQSSLLQNSLEPMYLLNLLKKNVTK